MPVTATPWRCRCTLHVLPIAARAELPRNRGGRPIRGKTYASPSYSPHSRDSLAVRGLVQNWGSGSNRGWRGCVVGWMEFLSESGIKIVIIDRAPNLE